MIRCYSSPMNFDTDTIQCGMPRSRKGEQITITIRPEDLATIDQLRGSTPRSEYMREASKGPVLRVSMELLETISKLAKARGMSPEGLLAVWADKEKGSR